MTAEHELRCPASIMFGKLQEGILEFKCRSSRCGSRPGVVVLHHFSATTGVLLETKVYRDPAHTQKNGA